MAKKTICFDEIREMAGQYMSDKDIRQMLSDIHERRASIKAQQKFSTVDKQIREATDAMVADKRMDAAKNALTEALHMIKRKEVLDRIPNFKDAAQAMEALLVGIHSKHRAGGRDSVDMRGKAYLSEYLGGLIHDLRKDGLLDVFTSRALDREIVRELFELSRKNGAQIGLSGSKEAMKIAATIQKYQLATMKDLNDAGAWIREVQGFVEHQSHDPDRLVKAGYEAWRKDISQWMDEYRTIGDVPPEKAEEYLKLLYNSLASGVHMKIGGEQAKLYGLDLPQNLAKKLSEHRSIHFKDGDSWYEYMQKYGQRGFVEQVVTHLRQAANQKALMEIWGPKPLALFEEVIDRLKVANIENPKIVKALDSTKLKDYWAELDGSVHIPASGVFAKVASGIRSIQTMAKLGGVILSSINDLPNVAAELRRNGINLFGGYARALESLFAGRSRGEVREMADMLLAGIEGVQGDVLGRWSARDGGPGQLTALARRFMNMTGLTWWTDALKTGVSRSLQTNLASNRGKAYGELGELGRMLGLYGIDESKWNIIRQVVRKAKDGREYLGPDLIRDLSGVDEKLKHEIETQLRSYLIDRINIAVLEPGARERAIFTRGTQPGTWPGEIARFIGQFKMFSAGMITKQLGSDVYSRGSDSALKGLLSGKADYLGLAHLMVSLTVFGYLSMSLKDMMKGRTPRDPMSADTWLAAMAQGGGAGIYGDFLFGSFNRFGRSALSSLAGPTISQVDDIVELWSRIKDGDDVGSNAFRMVMNNTPFVNLFYSRIAMDYLFLYAVQEHINPGYLRRMERRIKYENRQTYMFPPSRYAVGIR